MADRDDWSEKEVDSVVAAYFRMLSFELANQKYNKSESRRSLQAELNGRTEASIELKNRNISAVLLGLGCPYIAGYKPLAHYQKMLGDVVAERLLKDTLLDRAAQSAVEAPAVPRGAFNLDGIVSPPPVPSRVADSDASGYFPLFSAMPKRDYLDREARNRSLGDAGEAFVVSFERQRLINSGKEHLANRVEQVSKTKGDGLGYDVLSFEVSGRERFVEVKTTAFGKATPFFVSRNEIAFSESNAEQFRLYRVFDYRRNPRFFDLHGSIRSNVKLDPVNYIASFT